MVVHVVKTTQLQASEPAPVVAAVVTFRVKGELQGQTCAMLPGPRFQPHGPRLNQFFTHNRQFISTASNFTHKFLP